MPVNIPYLALQGWQGGRARGMRRQELAETMQRHRENLEQQARQFEAGHTLATEKFGEAKRQRGWSEFETMRQRYPFAQAPGPQQTVQMPQMQGRGVGARDFNPQQLDPEQFRSMIAAYQRSGRGGGRPASAVSGELESSLNQSLLSRRMALEDRQALQAPQWANVDTNRARLNWQKEKPDTGSMRDVLSALAGMRGAQGDINKLIRGDPQVPGSGVQAGDPRLLESLGLENVYRSIAGIGARERDPVDLIAQMDEDKRLAAMAGTGQAFPKSEYYGEPSAEGAGPEGWFAPGSMSGQFLQEEGAFSPSTLLQRLGTVPSRMARSAAGNVSEIFGLGDKPPPYKKQGPARGSVVPYAPPVQDDPYARAQQELQQIQQLRALLEGARAQQPVTR